jgi:bifunctional non-homologous end joining protein LigD
LLKDEQLPEVQPRKARGLTLRMSNSFSGWLRSIKTTGSKGFHIAVPLDAKADFATVARFAHRVGKLLVARDPENLTREFLKVDRRGRILVDTGRNDYSATFAAAYTVRARPGAPLRHAHGRK